MVSPVTLWVEVYMMISCLIPVGLTVNDTLYLTTCRFLEVNLLF